jgi:rhamnosyltransferase
VRSDVVVVIPTYRPTKQHIASIRDLAGMLEHIVVSDDASPCTFDPVLAELIDTPNTTLLRHRRNRGIARALNEGLTLATALGKPWLLTLDQDSRIDANDIDELVSTISKAQSERIGVVAPENLQHDGQALRYPTKMRGEFLTTAEVFQSGAVWSVAALNEVGGFDERLGIDAVDSAACLSLRRAGYLIVLAPAIHISHSYGAAQPITVMGRTIMSTQHSADRRTSMVRNRLRLLPKEFAASPIQGLRSLRRLAVNTTLAVTIEEDRWAKAKASMRGLLPKRNR